MSDAPRRRLVDRVSGSPTFIGVGTTVEGKLHCDGDLVVAGTVNGDSVVNGALTLSEGGRWRGDIQAANAVVAGEIEGSIVVSEKLEIRKSARIQGSVRARSLAVAQGAVIQGDMAVTSGGAVVHFEEKRER